MEMKFLTLLKDNNDWLDWLELWFGDAEGVDEPENFPCYVNCECVSFEDKDEEGDCKGEAMFAPHFLYHKDVEEMLENLE
jgi:hypothetical protein